MIESEYYDKDLECPMSLRQLGVTNDRLIAEKLVQGKLLPYNFFKLT
jgi:hypothetical protein